MPQEGPGQAGGLEVQSPGPLLQDTQFHLRATAGPLQATCLSPFSASSTPIPVFNLISLQALFWPINKFQALLYLSNLPLPLLPNKLNFFPSPLCFPPRLWQTCHSPHPPLPSQLHCHLRYLSICPHTHPAGPAPELEALALPSPVLRDLGCRAPSSSLSPGNLPSVLLPP